MAREQLELARDLIKQKRYQDAERLLKTIDHATARQWLEKLQPHLKNKAVSRKSGRAGWKLALGIILVITVATAILLIIEAQRREDVGFEYSVSLQCFLATDNQAGCDQMAERLIRVDRPSVVFCRELYRGNATGFMDCLRERGLIQ